jgi:hypothetical protein
LWVPLQKGWVFDSPQPQMVLVSPPMVTGYGPPRVLFTILAMVPPSKSLKDIDSMQGRVG